LQIRAAAFWQPPARRWDSIALGRLSPLDRNHRIFLGHPTPAPSGDTDEDKP